MYTEQNFELRMLEEAARTLELVGRDLLDLLKGVGGRMARARLRPLATDSPS